MAKFKRAQEVYFIYIKDGLHIGRDTIDEIHENDKGTRYWIGPYVCWESEVFETHAELSGEVYLKVNKALEKLIHPILSDGQVQGIGSEIL